MALILAITILKNVFLPLWLSFNFKYFWECWIYWQKMTFWAWKQRLRAFQKGTFGQDWESSTCSSRPLKLVQNPVNFCHFWPNFGSFSEIFFMICKVQWRVSNQHINHFFLIKNVEIMIFFQKIGLKTEKNHIFFVWMNLSNWLLIS